MKNTTFSHQPYLAGLFTLSLRWVVGWTYFSAFWRRLILDNKLIPEEAGYIGEKFNHFLPNALGIKPIIEYLVTHPDILAIAMIVFTIVEAVVGLLLMLGLFTRLMSIGVFALAMGILLAAGWLGTTCLDEWQIGILGLASGFTLFFTGSSAYALDDVFIKRKLNFTTKKWFPWLGSGNFPVKNVKFPVLVGSIAIFALSLFTNQYFHGGVWGRLHNKSVKPKLEISATSLKNDRLQFDVYRVEGADVYGSFLIGIHLLDQHRKIIQSYDSSDFLNLSNAAIQNQYIAKVKPAAHSMVIPLGAKATIMLPVADVKIKADEKYSIKLIDISGLEWESSVLMVR
ncbi:DoxX family membrane protein [Sphingobacterium olei]|uniref:DoxX family membrane protein n=1 Tax=Sphingobacterium olei TaxID=2571155 RepID=A0A4U0PJI1_9SPHI|nr:TQO small subunit DoxD [Sphingobacterium olei]TJZ63054.1 DoxX family membrane protein [Sphingobacterium olei]